MMKKIKKLLVLLLATVSFCTTVPTYAVTVQNNKGNIGFIITKK